MFPWIHTIKKNILYHRQLQAVVIFLTCVLAPSLLQAAVTDTEYLKNYFKVIWGLLIVLGVMLVLYGLLRKRFSILTSGAGKEIQVLEIKPLMGKKAICLVRVKDRELLLGISDTAISYLASFPNEHSTFEKKLQDATAEKTQ